MELGFLDGTGQKYTPTCVRIASANWRKSNTFVFSKCSLDIQVDELMILREESLKDKSITKQMDDLVSRLKGTESEVRRVGKVLTEKANEHAESRQTLHLEEFHALSKQFISFRNRSRDIALDLERTRLLHTPNISDNVLRADMRALILTQSNLVFATLNQCGSDSIREIAPTKVRFNVCVVDEAAQCVEPSVCIPLSLGVERCIMVGDPLRMSSCHLFLILTRNPPYRTAGDSLK
jgi:superfamily I DNA and/or RNA helicase